MSYGMSIKDMRRGDKIQGVFLLKAAVEKVTQAGKPYLLGVVSDCTGTMDMVCWDYAGPVGARDIGRAVFLLGTVTDHNGAPQLSLNRLRLAEKNDRYSMEALVPSAPIDAEEAMQTVKTLLDSIEDADYRLAAQTLLARNEEAFRNIPAAKSIHHAFLHGLLMHTVHMMRMADFLSRQYAEVIDRSLLLAAAFTHDLMKRREFLISELGVVSGYSMEGQLLGHLVMEAQELADIAAECKLPEEKALLLQHLILSHHGLPEWGAAVRPSCAEAELLFFIDMIDSRMEIFAETLQNTKPGEFSERVFALDNRRVYRRSN